jgi:hypothetical protein
MGLPPAPADPDTVDDDDAAQADRRYNELLQELRVAQTGVQFLFAFLLTLAFTQRFPEITSFQRRLYIGTLLVTSGASALLIGPVSLHRILSRRGLKPRLVRGGDLLARGGLALLLLGINGAVLLILDVVMQGPWAFVLAGLCFAWFVLVWYVFPMTAREHPRP